MKKFEKFEEVLSLLELARVLGKKGAVAMDDIQYYADENQNYANENQNHIPNPDL